MISNLVSHLKKLDLPRIAFLISATSAVFLFGVSVGAYKFFPYRWLAYGQSVLKELFAEREVIAAIRPTEHLVKSRYPGSGVTRFDAAQASSGLTMISGFMDGSNELRLINNEGNVINRWRPVFHDIFKDTSHITHETEVPRSDWNTFIQGFAALPDGSVIFNFEKKGLVKVDRCSTVQWTTPQMTHHSINLSADGSIWVPGMRYIDANSRFPIAPPYIEESILKISSEGKVLEEISILALLFENDLESEVLFANGLVGIEVGDKPDVTHLNDVEELSPELAPLFPMFTAGDLLVSERDFNLLMVVDPATRKIKWHKQGPWLSQHDPDFQTNSRIGVLSNNNDLTRTGSILGGSTIIELDVSSGTSSLEYGDKPDQRFFTKWAGAQQLLANQNRLIVESYGGRVFEVNRTGKIVWEYINGYDEKSTAVIYDAVRYPPDYFDVTDWSCETIK